MTAVVVSSAGVAVALASLLWNARSASSRDMATLADRLARLETKVDLFWQGVAVKLAGLLHSPHPEHARRDYLIESFMDGSITVVELAELVEALELIKNDHGADTGAQVAAAVVLEFIAMRYGLDVGGG